MKITYPKDVKQTIPLTEDSIRVTLMAAVIQGPACGIGCLLQLPYAANNPGASISVGRMFIDFDSPNGTLRQRFLHSAASKEAQEKFDDIAGKVYSRARGLNGLTVEEGVQHLSEYIGRVFKTRKAQSRSRTDEQKEAQRRRDWVRTHVLHEVRSGSERADTRSRAQIHADVLENVRKACVRTEEFRHVRLRAK